MPVWIDGWPLDLAISEESTYDSEVTEHPVEAGADISDHVRQLPIEIALECVVSDTPTGVIATHPTRDTEPGAPLASEAAWAKLLEIRAAGRPVPIDTGHRTLDSMVMVSLGDRRDISISGGILFTVRFKQVRIVENKRTTVRTATPRVKKASDRGLRTAQLVSEKGILWRKGQPPGTSPATDPPGRIVGQEYLKTDRRGQLTHQSGVPLTTTELEAFKKDMDRETALRTRQDLAMIDQRLETTGNKIERALKYSEARDQNPGKYIDPKLFGL